MDVGRFLPLKPGNLELIELIRAEIGKRGPVSFAWFMEQALYQPQHGYYSSGRAAIGRSGDYFTNVSVGGLFGKLLAAQFAEMWNRLGQIDDFTIVEQGAHDGQFAHDVLQAIRESSGDFFSKVRYRMIEPITVLEKRQRTTLASFREKVGWCRSIGALEPFTGVHFSNELLDAMPVHLISRSALAAGSEPAGERWRERLVDWQNGGFIFTDGSITDPNLEAHVRRLPSLAAGYETEINLNVTDWLSQIAGKLKCGFVLAIDYGFVRREFYSPHRTAGTLQCRAHHRLLASAFEAIGESDISAHVDWTGLAEDAEANGLRLSGFSDQHHFLTGIVSAWPHLIEGANPKTRRTLQTLLHPEMLGRMFQVFALSKAVDSTSGLSGFKFAKDARRSLGV